MSSQNSVLKQENIKLETWQFNQNEWNIFVKEARALKKEDSIYLGIAIVFLATMLIIFIRNASFLVALTIAVPFAFIFSWLRYYISIRNYVLASSSAIVEFYPTYIILNHKKIELYSANRWIKNMKTVRLKSNLNFLEIEISWATRKGNTFDELRVPIPKGKESEAERLIEKYKHYSYHSMR